MRYRSYQHRSRQGFRLSPVLILILVNVLLFIATLTNANIIYYLGLMPAGVLLRPWTIVTSMFLHSGLWHIIFNMWMLFLFGSSLSRLVGEGRFLFVYFCGGILGSVLFILLAPPFSIAVGASGAVYALGGAFAVMRPKQRFIIFPIPVPMPLWVVVLVFMVIFSFLPGIAWQAHLGGLVLGLIAGYFFRRRAR